MKKFKCIKGFCVPKCDDEGFETNKDMIIEPGTIWEIPEDKEYRLLGGEVRLESDDLGWLEMSNEVFKKYFEPIS